MRFLGTARKVLGDLEKNGERLELPHFLLYYQLQNPRSGAGRGIRGVRGTGMVNFYADGLERSWECLNAARLPFSPQRAQPITDSGGKTAVYIFHTLDLLYELTGKAPDPLQSERLVGSPFTYADMAFVPFIGLSCRSAEPDLFQSLEKAAVEAVHETTHVFNMSAVEPLLRTSKIKKWPETKRRLWLRRWTLFDEATAVFMERRIYATFTDNLRYGLNWVDHPEFPMDTGYSGRGYADYEAWAFVQYLVRRFGWQFINRVWMEAEINEDPFAAIQRLAGLPMDKNRFETFGPYCADSYFFYDPHSCAFAPDVYVRFGPRVCTECVRLSAGREVVLKGETEKLDHLACRYYRIEPVSPFQQIHLRVSWQHPGNPRLSAFAAVCRHDLRRGTQKQLEPDGGCDLVAVIDADKDCDHIVLTVANCGTRPRVESEKIEHDDAIAYSVTIKVV